MILESGKALRIVTNDLDAPADEIAYLYKQRWQIELFFRWVKQTLRITHFLGTSENAVRIQIAVALIAFLLLRWHKRHKKTYTARSTSFVSCGRTSCKDVASINCSNRHRRSRSIKISSVLDYTHHEPDSRGTSPAMTR